MRPSSGASLRAKSVLTPNHTSLSTIVNGEGSANSTRSEPSEFEDLKWCMSASPAPRLVRSSITSSCVNSRSGFPVYEADAEVVFVGLAVALLSAAPLFELEAAAVGAGFGVGVVGGAAGR